MKYVTGGIPFIILALSVQTFKLMTAGFKKKFSFKSSKITIEKN